MYVLSQKPVGKQGSILFNIWFTQFRENGRKSGNFNKTFILGGNAFTDTFTF